MSLLMVATRWLFDVISIFPAVCNSPFWCDILRWNFENPNWLIVTLHCLLRKGKRGQTIQAGGKKCFADCIFFLSWSCRSFTCDALGIHTGLRTKRQPKCFLRNWIRFSRKYFRLFHQFNMAACHVTEMTMTSLYLEIRWTN